jgi:ppGpp synthetase/RelA/SpoT-type nucleotidyltranferase
VAEPEAVRQAFNRVQPLLADVRRYVHDTLDPYCRKLNYIFIDREKTVTSLAEKLEGGRIAAWSDLDDLYAGTVVVPTAEHEDGVVRKLDASFERVRLRRRSDARKAPDVFRFDGVRWYGHLREETGAERQAGVGEQLFEVQVVTAFEYAWIAVTHDLVYKADNADWQRQRLAAQLKAAVEQIEVLIAAFDPASSMIQESPWPETTAKTLIIDRCKLLVSDGYVPDTLRPDSWRRFADNVFGLVRTYESNPRRTGAAVSALLDVIEADLRGPTPFELPISGTLFQYVVSVVARDDTAGSIENFTVVPSRELSDLYGLRDLPKPFRFDGFTAALPAPEPDVQAEGPQTTTNAADGSPEHAGSAPPPEAPAPS